MGFNFPNSPLEGQVYQPVGGPAYIWRNPVWETISGSDGGSDGTVTPQMFGAKGDGTTDDTLAFESMLASGAVKCVVPAVTYKITRKLIVPDGVEMTGQGGGYEFATKTTLLFYGTGTKEHTIPGATSTSVANPDAGAPYLADSGTRGDAYKTLNLTSTFSAAIILGKGSILRNLGIFPNFDGVAGYAGADNRLSDNWDVGVWARNADWWTIENCNVMGHWRKAALLVSAHDIGDGKPPACELGHAERCTFQGFVGVSIRSPETVTGSNWGFAGTDFINCLIRALHHQSLHLSTSSFLATPFSQPGASLEISGDVMRGIQFLNCTFIQREDIAAFFGKCSEIQFEGSYWESKQIKVSGSTLANSEGSRMVGTADTLALKFLGNSKTTIDMSSTASNRGQAREGGLAGKRYPSTAGGVFSAASHFDDDYAQRIFSSYSPYRLRTSNDSWAVDSADGSRQAIRIYDTGSTVAPHFSSGTITVNDDAAGTIPVLKLGGFCFITYAGNSENSAFPNVLMSGVVGYDVGTSVNAQKTGGGSSFTVLATDVTGTTGTDGQVTVGAIAGNLRVENRSGAVGVFRYFFMG